MYVISKSLITPIQTTYVSVLEKINFISQKKILDKASIKHWQEQRVKGESFALTLFRVFFFMQNGSPSFHPIDLLVFHYGPLIINWNYWHFVPHHVVFSVYKCCSLIVPLTYGFCGWGNCTIIHLFMKCSLGLIKFLLFHENCQNTIMFKNLVI